MQAALQTIRDRGFDGFRIRDVAEAAGVSTATVHYYFDDLDGLMTEVHALATERFFTDRLESIALHDDAREKLVEMIRMGIPETADDPITIALYHIDNAKRADPVRSVLGTSLFDRQVLLWSSPGAWCTSSSRDSSTGWFRRSVPLGWPPVLWGCR